MHVRAATENDDSPGSTEGLGDTFDDNSYGIDGETTTRGT